MREVHGIYCAQRKAHSERRNILDGRTDVFLSGEKFAPFSSYMETMESRETEGKCACPPSAHLATALRRHRRKSTRNSFLSPLSSFLLSLRVRHRDLLSHSRKRRSSSSPICNLRGTTMQFREKIKLCNSIRTHFVVS